MPIDLDRDIAHTRIIHDGRKAFVQRIMPEREDRPLALNADGGAHAVERQMRLIDRHAFILRIMGDHQPVGARIGHRGAIAQPGHVAAQPRDIIHRQAIIIVNAEVDQRPASRCVERRQTRPERIVHGDLG